MDVLERFERLIARGTALDYQDGDMGGLLITAYNEIKHLRLMNDNLRDDLLREQVKIQRARAQAMEVAAKIADVNPAERIAAAIRAVAHDEASARVGME